MHPTRNDMLPEYREKLAELLNAQLADLIDLSLQAKQAHWNVKGPSFIALHELFDGVYGVVVGAIDEVAERVVALGGTAAGTLQVVGMRTRLPAYSLSIMSGAAHVGALAAALATVGKSVRTAIDRATELGDAGTADLFTGVSRDLDQQLWFVEAHAQGKE